MVTCITNFSTILLLGSLFFPSNSIAQQQQVVVANLRGNGPASVVLKTDDANQDQARALVDRNKQLSLIPGDLPGYTGWARPPYSDAPYYMIDGLNPSGPLKHVGEYFEVIIRCDTPDSPCYNKHPQFYSRMYGPSVISPLIEYNFEQNRYVFKYLPLDVGSYYIEIVLGSSDVKTDSLLIEDTKLQFEGYMLKEFPIHIEISEAPSPNADAVTLGVKPFNYETSNPMCTDIYVKGQDDAIRMGRWRVTDKVNTKYHLHNMKLPDTKLSHFNYFKGYTSLGITMEYDMTNGCLLYDPLVPENFERYQKAKQKFMGDKVLQLILIGDSVIGNQELAFNAKEHWVDGSDWGVNATQIATNGGIEASMQYVKDELNKTWKDYCATNKNCIIVYNSGLHDISIHFMNSIHGPHSQVMKNYASLLTEFSNVVADFPAQLRIFQTTTAAWPKWGNWGAAWEPTRTQELMFSSSTTEFINRIALDEVLPNFPSINAVDLWHLTYSRPDNREIQERHLLEKKMVHPGWETTRAMLRQIMTILVNYLENNTPILKYNT